MSLKVGRVSAVDAAAATAVVVFGGDDALASWTLPVMQAKTGGDRAYWLPDPGSLVACLMDEHAEFGVVLGGIYSQADAPPIASLDALHVAFKDGSTFEYDRAAHRLAITLAGDAAAIDITAAGEITIVSSAASIMLSVPDGQHVTLGGSDQAKRLATEDFVTEVYEQHKHPTPAGLSGPPIEIPGAGESPNVTTKAVAE